MTEDEATEALRIVLADAMGEGIIENYFRCPGVPIFDVWPIPGDEESSIQISVRA